MLSRIAESLFWIGRYVERADDTARLLQTHLRLLVEDSSALEVDACRNLLALMSVDDVEDPTHLDLLRVLAYDAAQPTSINSCWAAARDNARRAREVIPLDLWECINTTWQQLPRAGAGVTAAHTDLNWARDRSALFAGISRSIMVRDDGWQFMSMGRSLGAGRHDVAAGRLRIAGRREYRVAVGAARLRWPRCLPAHVSRGAHRS